MKTTKDKIIVIVLLLIIILSILWIIHILIKTPIAKQISTGTEAIQSGIPAEDKALIDQKGN